MNPFNKNKKSSNVMKSASLGMLMNILKVIMGFGYRTFFLSVLSAAYLGINGLFTNILQILSLAELGVTTAIVFRFYEPISRGDVAKVGRLMNYFRTVYHTIAFVIMAGGLSLIPLLPSLINSSDSVPADINLTLVYILFLINTVSSYIFSYKLTLLNADQRNYQFAVIDAFISLLRYLVQVIILFSTRNYTLTLAAGIAATLLSNYIFSIWVTNQYKEVFAVTEKLEQEDRKIILNDTKACMYHKVGTCILTGTDSAVLTKMVNLVSAGLYSNYSLILLSLQAAIGQLLGNFISSLGNARLTLSKEDYYRLYKKFNFFGLWVTSITTVCLYVAIDDFVQVWLGKDYVLGHVTTAVLCIQYFMQVSSDISMSFTNASGLFVKDKLRPLIEASINLVVSVILAHYWGVTGVFAGTVISILLTTFWRIPFVLYKYDFKRSTGDYWKQYIPFTAITALMCLLTYEIKKAAMIKPTLLFVFIELIVSMAIMNAGMILLYRNKEEYLFAKDILKGIARRFIRKEQ